MNEMNSFDEKLRIAREAALKSRGERVPVDHTVRTEDGGTVEIRTLTRGKAIKIFCTECMGWHTAEVARCTSNLCPLFPFRGASMIGKSKKGHFSLPEGDENCNEEGDQCEDMG